LVGKEVMDAPDRTRPNNALGNHYRTSDGHFVSLGFIQSDRYWERFCEVIGRPEAATDPRFQGEALRAENVEECVKLLDEAFGERTLAEWEVALKTQEGPWSIIQSPSQAADDPQALLNGYVHSVEYASGAVLPMVGAPVQFDQEVPTLRPASELGADTDDVLLANGYTWDDLIRLKQAGAIS
jgi:crotonobetainyl-CoA:carnitine CoA-transferase CaiB-like acyl-CoA transferase